MELFIPHNCVACGVTDEAKFLLSGPHVKQVCNHCGKYVKFVSKGFVPDHNETKLRIWAITQDTCYIDAAKELMGFVENTTGVERKLMYWRLYLKLREMEVVND